MTWTEEAAVETTWSETQLGAFQPGFQFNAFQFDAFQIAPDIPWVEDSEAASSWSEEAEL